MKNLLMPMSITMELNKINQILDMWEYIMVSIKVIIKTLILLRMFKSILLIIPSLINLATILFMFKIQTRLVSSKMVFSEIKWEKI